MFFWEESCGRYVAKAKTEMGTLGTTIFSPFSSHGLLTTLLSTPRKQRDKHFNKLYDSMIKLLSPDLAENPYQSITKE